MDNLLIVLRLLHIVGGVFWVGTAILNTFFISPSVAATADAGQMFMGQLLTRARLTMWVTWAAYVTVLAGIGLYWIDSQGFTSAWQNSGPGVGFGLGGIAAVVGLGFGQIVGRSGMLLAKIASELRGSPTPEQMAAMGRARARMASASWISTSSLLIALVCMATARYWSI